jgi:hypothetical protein
MASIRIETPINTPLEQRTVQRMEHGARVIKETLETAAAAA